MCLFCKIAAGEIPSKKAYEDESVYAFYDIAPQAPVHILVIPKAHIESAQQLTREDDALLGHMFEVARKIATENGLDKTGYRLITNVGADAGQSVPHLHLHLIGGKTLKWDN
jgi:histidine triad (HIT) family protein